MTFTWRNAMIAAAAAILWTGCSSSPPGGGLTNGEPVMIGGSEKAAEPTGLPAPTQAGGDESLAAPATDSPANPSGGIDAVKPTPDATPPAAEAPPAKP